MQFFKKKDDHWKSMLRIVEIMKLTLAELGKRIDILEEKFKTPVLKKKLLEKSEEEKDPQQTSINDGFDELRQLRKDLNMTFS